MGQESVPAAELGQQADIAGAALPEPEVRTHDDVGGGQRADQDVDDEPVGRGAGHDVVERQHEDGVRPVLAGQPSPTGDAGK